MLRSSRRLTLFAPASAAALMLGASCAKNPQINFSVSLGSGVGQSTQWVEVGIFSGGTCPTNDQLTGGLPASGYVSRLAFRSSDASPPALGDLPKGTYAFAAVARADDCSVVGVGCTVADLTTARDVAIAVGASANPATACSAGSVCDYARCVPSRDNGAAGAACSLELVGAGPLGDPLDFGGTFVSAPAVAATDTGFLIGYREYDALLGAARLTLIPIDLGGASGAPQATTLPGQCPASDESDATALAFAGSGGVAAVARAPCSDVGGVDLFEVDATGAVAKSSFNGGMGVSISLATSHALAPLPDKSGYLLAFSENDETHVAKVTDLTVQSAAAPGFGGAAPQSAGWVATSDKMIALLAAGSGASSVDAGADGGDNDAGAVGTSIRLDLVAPNANLGALPAPSEVPASFGSVAALGTRAFVVSDGIAIDQPVTWRVFDLGAPPGPSDSFAVMGLGKILFADVALNKDHAFFAVEQPGSITLVAYDHATTSPTLLRTIYLPRDARVPAMSAIRDGRIAIAASDTRVVVTWTTGQTLLPNDVVGGYAMFACTTP